MYETHREKNNSLRVESNTIEIAYFFPLNFALSVTGGLFEQNCGLFIYK